MGMHPVIFAKVSRQDRECLQGVVEGDYPLRTKKICQRILLSSDGHSISEVARAMEDWDYSASALWIKRWIFYQNTGMALGLYPVIKAMQEEASINLAC